MIGLRLKEERERLGYTQPVFAELAGAKKRTLIDWEKGTSSPTAVQMAELAKIGVDVLYVLTGMRTQVHQVLSHVKKAADAAMAVEGQTDEGRAALHEQVFRQLNNELSPREQALLDNYRNTPPDRQRFIEDAAVMASQRRTAKGGRK